MADGEANLTDQWPETMSALDLDIEPEVCIVNQKARRYHVYAYSESEEGHSAAEPDECLYMFGMEYDDSGGACMRGTCRSTAVSGDFKICFSETTSRVATSNWSLPQPTRIFFSLAITNPTRSTLRAEMRCP